MELYSEIMKNCYGVDEKIISFVTQQEQSLEQQFKYQSDIAQYNQIRILHSMQKHKLVAADFNWTTGYGYGDIGREKIESIYASVFSTEDALVRPNIVSGTHAISLALFSILQSGDHLLSLSGRPYDTLLKVIGVKGSAPGNLQEQGIEYSEIPLNNGCMDLSALEENLKHNTKVVMIQRSTGYSDRRAFTIEEIQRAISAVKQLRKDIVIFVDNCYGEFTNTKEPTQIGADIMAGSLIKNPGGGLAYSGGYIVGKKELIQRAANRLTAPGIGKECGLTFGMSRQILQGLFIAPKIVEDAVKAAILFAKVFEELGFDCIPKSTDERSDIILALKLQQPEILEEFCKYIQFSSPVDSIFTPKPWDMPGYEDQVIMAAGGFIEGSSIELSADGPMREPYYAYYQGGLTYYHAKIALFNVLNSLLNQGYISLKM